MLLQLLQLNLLLLQDDLVLHLACLFGDGAQRPEHENAKYCKN